MQLADMLHTKDTLTKLEVYNNKTSGAGANELPDVLRGNATITHLSINRDDKISTDAKATLAALVVQDGSGPATASARGAAARTEQVVAVPAAVPAAATLHVPGGGDAAGSVAAAAAAAVTVS